MKRPYMNRDGYWKCVPSKTTVQPEWTCLVLDNGNKILTFGDVHEAGASVHILNEGGGEMVMYDRAEWEESPEQVMGAILRTAGGVS